MANLKGYLKDSNNNKIYPDDYDTGWIKVTQFYNGAGHFAEATSPVQYRRIGKIVYLNGLLSSGTQGVQFNLPEGFRPTSDYRCYILRDDSSTIRGFVNYNSQNGDFYLEGSTVGHEVALAPVSFIADV